MKNKKVIIPLIIILVIIIVLATIWLIIKNDKTDPASILKTYMSYIEKQDYEAMYELTTKQTDEERFLTRNKNIYEGIEASNIKVSVAKVTKGLNSAEVLYNNTMDTMAGEVSFLNTAYMSKDGDTYKIKWSSSLIYPELKEDYKIRVSTEETKRGSLLDRNGNVLAGQQTTSQVGLVPGKMNTETKEADIKTLSELLDISVDTINKNLTQSYVKEDTFVPLRTILKSEVALKEKLLQIGGVKIVDTEERIYPLGEATSHLLGYVQKINAEELEAHKSEGYTSSSVIGKSGLEKIFESRLKGTNGAEIYMVDDTSTKIKTIAKRNVKDGENIKLTIDSELQQKIYEVYKEEKSATVAINPKTGEILAAVSTPTFNSNSFSLGMTNAEWESLSNDENLPLYNRFLSSYAPGSSFKPITGAIGLTRKAFTADENFGRSGTRWQKDSSWGNFYISTLATYSGAANIRNALIYSDNIYFAKAAIKIGGSNFADSLKMLGYNSEISTGIGNVKSSFSNTDTFETETKLANSGYGQAEMLVNPIHTAMVYSAFVNKGNMINTYIEYKDTKQVSYYKENVFSPETVDTITEALTQVIENPGGTAHSAQIDGLKLAGKTGTAEIKASKDDTDGREIGWFNCFIADENSQKQLMIISMIEDVQDKGGSHYVVDKVKTLFE